jgi:hypothetical protein
LIWINRLCWRRQRARLAGSILAGMGLLCRLEPVLLRRRAGAGHIPLCALQYRRPSQRGDNRRHAFQTGVLLARPAIAISYE